MNKLHIALENCYGIKKLDANFDFTTCPVHAVYAPNGTMKSSLAKTFKDVSEGVDSKDRIFPKRVTTRLIQDESNADVSKEEIFVIPPYDDVIGHTEKTSTLLVDAKLRRQYEDLHADIAASEAIFIKALQEQSGSAKNIKQEISATFTKTNSEFYIALNRIKDEVLSQSSAPFSKVVYDALFDDKIITFLSTKDVKTAIEEYIKKYNELLQASNYFKKGVFNYHNAATIAKSLTDNGFFTANHTVKLNGESSKEITSQEELAELIESEKNAILTDADLKKKFKAFEKLINKNANLRDFEAYLSNHEEILSKLTNIDAFKEELWKSYIFEHIDLYKDLLSKHASAETRKKEIEAAAAKQRTQWEEVIEIFNARFFVPFKLEAENRLSVVLGEEKMLNLGFSFEDGAEQVSVDKSTLMQSLSTGEKKAFYILNVIFEIEARKKASQPTLFIVDDIADSFDYRNKYAIVQYLKDMSEQSFFKLILLTHNFDFFRTVESRFVKYTNCRIAIKSGSEITLVAAKGIKNVFVKDWKLEFFNDSKKRIASIPFVRNIIEFTLGEASPQFLKLTSLLHWKVDSVSILQSDLDAIYNAAFNEVGAWTSPTTSVVEDILTSADACTATAGGFNLENKVVLSLGIRIRAEQFMVSKINDAPFVASIDHNQTGALMSKFKAMFSNELAQIEVLSRVQLMTPENIHLNAFMYEPLVDMSDDHLIKLYSDVKALS